MASSGGLGALTFDLLLETVGWVTGLNKAEHDADKAAKEIQRKFDKLGDAIQSAGKKMLVGLTAGLTVDAIVEVISKTADLADRLDELASKTGTSVEAMAELSVYAKMSGSSVEAVAASIVKFNKQVMEARGSSGSEAGQIFKAMGLELKNADKSMRSMEDVNKDALMTLGSLEDGAEKTALAIKLYGKAGADLIPVANAMYQASDELVESTNRYKKALKELAPIAGQLEEQQTIASNTMTEWAAHLGASIIPYCTELLKIWNDLTQTGGVLQTVVDAVVNAFKGIVITVDAIITSTVLMAKAFIATQTALGKLLTGDLAGAKQTIMDFGTGAKSALDGLGTRAMALVDGMNAIPKVTKPLKPLSDDLKKLLQQGKQVEIAFGGDIIKPLDTAGKGADRLSKSLAELDKNMEALARQERKQLADFRSVGDEAEVAAQKIGMTATEVARLDAYLKLLDKTKGNITMEEFAAQWERVNAAISDKAAREEYLSWLTEMEGAWHNAFDAMFSDTKGGWNAMLDSLKKSFKKMLVDYLYTAFAKPIFLQFVGSMTGQGVPGSMMQGASSIFGGGAGSSGGLFDSVMQYFGGTGTGGLFGQQMPAGQMGPAAPGIMPSWFSPNNNPWGGAGVAGAGIVGGMVGGWGAGALGAGQRGVQAGQQWGSTLGAIGMMTPLGPIGAAIGMAIGVAIGKATDPDPDAMRAAVFGSTQGATGVTPWTGTSALGSFGFSQGEWLSDKDMGESMSAFIAGIKDMDNALSKFMSPEQIERVKKRLEDAGKRYELGMEHGGVDGLTQITKDRLAIITSEISKGLGAFVTAFQGPVEEIISIVGSYLQATTMATDFDPQKIADDMKPQTMMESYQAGIGSLNEYITGLDTSAESMSGLVGQMGAFQAATVAMISAIDAAAASMHQMFMDTAAEIQMSTMNDDEKYKFLQERSQRLFEQMQTETDPAKIEALAKQINADINSAWGMLDESGRAALKEQYLDRLEMVDTTVAEKMKALKDVITEDSKTIMEDITAKLDLLFGKADVSANTTATAANKMDAAANTLASAVGMVAVNGA